MALSSFQAWQESLSLLTPFFSFHSLFTPHLCFSFFLFFFKTTSYLSFHLSPSIVSWLRFLQQIQHKTSACMLGNAVLSDLIKATLSLPEHTERCRARPSASGQKSLDSLVNRALPLGSFCCESPLL